MPDWVSCGLAGSSLASPRRARDAPQAVERGLELHFAYEADVPKMLKGDPTRISQVLIDLAGNGLKFTSRGSFTMHRIRVPRTSRTRHTSLGPSETSFELRHNGGDAGDHATTVSR